LSFGSPQLLGFLALVPLAALGYWGLERRRRARSARWASPELLPNMASQPGARRAVPAALFLLATSALLVGFARPERHVTDVKPGATIVLALDVSGSMAASDVAPSRLGAADAILTRFVDSLPASYRVALLTFSADYALRVTPTFDHAALLKGLPRSAQLQGSAIGDALAGAVKVALRAVGPLGAKAQRPPAAILLVSDGSQNEGQLSPTQASALAKKAGIPVSTLVLGTASGIVTQRLKVAGSTKRFNMTTRVPVSATTLKQIAAATGGGFYEGSSAGSLDAVYHALAQRLLYQRRLSEITVWLSGAGIGLMLAGALLSGLWFRRLV
jgi:Ca-activated chloride channel family protein